MNTTLRHRLLGAVLVLALGAALGGALGACKNDATPATPAGTTRRAAPDNTAALQTANQPASDSPDQPALRHDRTARAAAVTVTITAPETVEPWSMATAGITVTNGTGTAILLSHVGLTAGGDTTIVGSAVTATLTATREGDTFTVNGTYYVEDLGPIARAPMPPYWKFEGDDSVSTAVLLAPGASRTWDGQFRARYEAAGQLQASVRYVALLADVPPLVLQATSATLAPPEMRLPGGGKPETPGLPRLPPPGGMPSGKYEPTLVARITYAPAARPIADAEGLGVKPLRFTSHEPSPTVALPPGFQAFAYALPQGAASPAMTSATGASRPLMIGRFPYDIAQAREAAGVAEGAYTRALAAKCWALSGGEDSVLVDDAGTTVAVLGDVLPLVERLNRNATSVQLGGQTEVEDGDGHAEALRALGFETRSERHKDGTYENRARLEPAKLLDFVRALAERQLALTDGGRRALPRN